MSVGTKRRYCLGGLPHLYTEGERYGKSKTPSFIGHGINPRAQMGTRIATEPRHRGARLVGMAMTPRQ